MELRDAIYGDIILQDNETESKIIDTFEMQRLKLIKQLGFVNFVYPCANHTRFEHSLGTRWIAQKIVTLSELKPKDQKVLYLAALIHDIAEPCFVHVTERLKKLGMKSHEEIIKIILDGTYKDKVIELKGEEFKNVNFICDVLKDNELDEVTDLGLKSAGISADASTPHQTQHPPISDYRLLSRMILDNWLFWYFGKVIKVGRYYYYC